jgi:hypothetical protein
MSLEFSYLDLLKPLDRTSPFKWGSYDEVQRTISTLTAFLKFASIHRNHSFVELQTGTFIASSLHVKLVTEISLLVTCL